MISDSPGMFNSLVAISAARRRIQSRFYLASNLIGRCPSDQFLSGRLTSILRSLGILRLTTAMDERTIGTESPPEASKTAEFSTMNKAWQFSEQTLKQQIAALIEIARTPGCPSLAECSQIVVRTCRLWLIVVTTIFGLIAVIPLARGATERWRNAREIRYEQAVASVTPDRLIARCGQPTEDATKTYPIVMRTISYRFKSNKTVMLVFSRTVEGESDWVFLTMKDGTGARSFDTPGTKIAALPCLDSKE